MSEKKIEEIVFELSSPLAEKNNCEVVDVEFLKEGGNWFLRVYIDKEAGVTLDDCEAVSRLISDELDRVDPISQAYFLEVSSPGLNRKLKTEKDFTKYKGHNIEIKLYKPLNGRKIFSGVLVDYKDEMIFIKLDTDDVMEFNIKACAKVNLAFEN